MYPIQGWGARRGDIEFRVGKGAFAIEEVTVFVKFQVELAVSSVAINSWWFGRHRILRARD